MTVDWVLLERLLETPGLPGWEEAVADLIASEAGQWAPVRRSPLGNLRVTLGAGRPRVVFCAHMDEVGLLAVGVDADGAVRFRPLGGVDDAALPGRHVRVVTPSGLVPGVIGISPPHLREGGETPAGWRDLAIDIGVNNRQDAAALGIRPPQPVTFLKFARPLRSREALIAKGLDDRVGCFVLIHLLRHTAALALPLRFDFLWTVQDEVGLRGASHAAAEASADYVVQWDAVSDAAQFWGRGILIRARDDGAFADPELLRWTCDCARRAGVPFEVGVCRGESEAKAFQDGGARVVSVNIAVANMHSESEMVAESDVVALLRLGEEMVAALHSLPGGRTRD